MHNHPGVLRIVHMNGNIQYFRDILLIIISRGTNNCVQRVFKKKKHLFNNEISPHFQLF